MTTDVGNVSSKAETLPVVEGALLEEGTTTDVTVEGAVQPRQFQSILLNEIFTHKPNQSMARTALVALLALPLLPILGLYDMIRYGLFQYGKCDGKSWSLIEKATEAVAHLAKKVDTVAKKEMTTTSDDVNTQLEQRMKGHVEKIVAGYRKLQGGLFGRSFDSSRAIKGEKQIYTQQRELISTMADYLNANVERPEDFAPLLEGTKVYVRSLFAEAAKEDIYVSNKMERKGPRPLLSDVATFEFESALKGHTLVAASFLNKVDQSFTAHLSAAETREEDQVEGVPSSLLTASQAVARHLRTGIEQGLITAGQSKQKMQQLAQDMYGKAIAAAGPQEAASVTRDFLQEGVKAGLFQEEEVEEMERNIRFSPKELATAVVQHVVQNQLETLAAEPADLDAAVFSAAQELKSQGKLDAEDEVEFFAEAREQLDVIQEEIEAKVAEMAKAEQEAEMAAALKAEQEAQETAALKAKEEAEALELAQKQEMAEKLAAERQTIVEALGNFLSLISEKQQELLNRYGIYTEQNTEKAALVRQLSDTLRTKVQVGKDKKEMTVLQAYEYRGKKIAEINASNRTPDQQMAKLAQFDQDFGAEAVAVIDQLRDLEEKINEQTMVMSETLKAIDSLDLEIGSDLATYKNLSKQEKKKLEKEQRAEILGLQKEVAAIQTELNDRYRQVHGLSPFSPLPSEKAEATEAQLEEFLAPQVEGEEPSPTNSYGLWNRLTAPFHMSPAK